MKAALITLILINCMVALASGCCTSNCDNHTSPVKTVGGCDKYGDCGVLLEDGTYLVDASQPVVGTKPHGPYCRAIR